MCILCSLRELSATLLQSTARLADATDPLIGAEGIGDSLYPGFGNGGYDVQHYDLDLNITDVGSSALNGLTTLSKRQKISAV